MPNINITDMRKLVSYLYDASKLYDALPMQKCKSRAHMIRKLIKKIEKSK